MALTQTQLADAVAERAGLSRVDAKSALAALEEVVLDQIGEAEKVKIGNLVQLTVRLKPGRRLWGYWPTFEGKYRVEFVLKSIPFVEGRYYVTLAVHSRDSKRVYHMQEQRHSFDVVKGEENPGAVWIPVECRAERL